MPADDRTDDDAAESTADAPVEVETPTDDATDADRTPAERMPAMASAPAADVAPADEPSDAALGSDTDADPEADSAQADTHADDGDEAEDRPITPEAAPDLTLADIPGLEAQKNELKRTLFHSAERPDLRGYAVRSAVVYGPHNAGKRRFVRAIAGELGARGYQFAQLRTFNTHEMSATERMERVIEVAREHAPMVVLLDCFDEIHGMGAAREIDEALDTLRETGEQVIVLGVMHERRLRNDLMAAYYRAFDVRFELEKPDRERRRAVIEQTLTELRARATEDIATAGLDVDRLAIATEGFGVDDLRLFIRRALLTTARPLETDALLAVADTVREERVEAILAKHSVDDIDVSDIGFDDVGGLDAAERQLRELLELPMERAEAYDAFDLPTNSGVLLHGPPGNGKTLLAKAVANETGRTFISVAGPELVNPLGEGTEQRLRNIFEKARRNAPAVVFFDEFDSVGTKRGRFDGTKDDVVNTLLTELDGLRDNDNVVVIAATNRLETLDPALLRSGRFEHLIEVAPPSNEAAREVFAVHSRSLPLAADVTADWFVSRAMDDLSGADIATICKQAGIVAVRRVPADTPTDEIVVTREDFEEALESFATSRGHRQQTDDRMFG